MTGLVVTGTYSDNSTATETMTTAATTGFSTLTAGIKTITITISGKITTFTITVTGGTVVPSQSVFPIGVWLQSPIRVNNGKLNVVEYKSIGINRFVGLWKWPDETGFYKGYNLQVAKALKDNGMKVYAGDSLAAVDWLKANPEYSDTFIGYMLGDEPDMFKINYDPVKAPQWLWVMPDTWKNAGDALRAADPTKEFYANFGKPFAKGVYTPVAGSTIKADFEKYVSPTTVYSCDYYGITDPYEPLNNHGVWTYGRAVKLSSQYSNGRSVYGFIEVSSPWKVTSSAVEVPDRMPAHLVMPIVWNMVISGAKGITYFCHDFLTTLGADGCLKEPGMAEAMAAANASLQKYADILLSPDVSGTTVNVTGNVDVITLTKKFGGSTYVFAMGNGNSTNIYGAPVTATINVAGVGTGTVQVDNENRSVTITNGSFTENFGAYELHIYKIAQ